MRTVLTLMLLAGCSGQPQTDGNCGTCSDYIACCTKISGATQCRDDMFGAMGTCWSTTQAVADSCCLSCRNGNDAYRKSGVAADAGCTFK